jgi:hypothetical protein
MPLYAPDAYRVAIPALGRLLLRMFRLKDPTGVAAALDFFFSFFALYLFYRLATDDSPFPKGERTQRIVIVALFLAFVQFPIAWVVPWRRPETLPSAFFLAFALFCLARARKGIIWSVLLLAAAAWQAFVRFDVAFVFGIALVLLSLGRRTLEEFGSRSSNLLRGICITVIVGAVQGYLQLIRFPHLQYWPGVDVVQFKNNLQLHDLSNCVIALFPFLLLAIFLVMKRIRLQAIDAVVVASSALYFPLWFTVGVAAEVRIYVPFMMALCVVAARVAASFLTLDDLTSLHSRERVHG